MVDTHSLVDTSNVNKAIISIGNVEISENDSIRNHFNFAAHKARMIEAVEVNKKRKYSNDSGCFLSVVKNIKKFNRP